MKKVGCIIRPSKIDNVREVLGELGVQGMAVSEVKGFGRPRGHTKLYRGAEYTIEFVPKRKVEVVVPDEELEAVVEAVLTVAPRVASVAARSSSPVWRRRSASVPGSEAPKRCDLLALSGQLIEEGLR